MKITFLGTSHGVPGDNRYCQSFLVEENESGYLVDAGAPVIDILLRRNYPLSKLKAIFITHVHGDHIDGLISLLDLANWYYKDMDLDVYLPESRAIELIKEIMSINNNYKPIDERIRFHCYSSGEVYSDNNIRLKAFESNHTIEYNKPAFGFFVCSKHKKICITGDRHRTLNDFPVIDDDNPVDLFITECAHFSPESLIEKIRFCNAKEIAVVHVFTLDKYARLEELKDKYKLNISFPEDGQEYELN